MYKQHEDTPGWTRFKGNRVYKALKNLIVDFKVPPYTRLDMREISDVLKTSATPIREALIKLETEKYIVGSTRNGYYTKKLDTKQLSDKYAFINMILQHALRENLDEHSKPWPVLPTNPSWNDYYLIREFLEVLYDGIAESSNNERMLDLVREFNIRTRYVRFLDLQRPERLSCIRGDMSELLELLDKRDKNGAIANVDRQFSAIINTVPELVLEGNHRAGNTKESWLETLLLMWTES
ncbi:GntR family transcriptional regulator (plasmid) [Mesorhizobium sp. AR02]|uniref:GntR family transcriptional regulator n=1 Tax=Mesorhizobium sp. AR02 TaxID=2865837 RepID=UPI00215FC001|nr:GntR family transcriptional regulator [Mesorhizobium sp. AR02]UVK49837.1 GntR family transcriptional regulator [Mesorhizobium sp. AR02]